VNKQLLARVQYLDPSMRGFLQKNVFKEFLRVFAYALPPIETKNDLFRVLWDSVDTCMTLAKMLEGEPDMTLFMETLFDLLHEATQDKVIAENILSAIIDKALELPQGHK